MKKSVHAVPNVLLKAEREGRGWSQKYVADQLGAAHYYLSRWERGTTFPSPYYRQKLCDLFGKNAKELGLLPPGSPPRDQEATPTISGQQGEEYVGPARAILDPAILLSLTGNAGSIVERKDLALQDKNIVIFPPGQSSLPSERTPLNNLPAKLTPFIGREEEVATVCALLSRPEVRLVTLTGTGGVGKTSLSLEVASSLLPACSDGIFFVSLAPISDPRLVIPAIAHTLDLWEARDQSLMESLKAYLLLHHPLLLLDNFEQVIEAGPFLIELLQACPDLKILVTSRSTLRLSGEYEYVVPALAVPDLTHLPTLEDLAKYAAIALFVQQAKAIKPEFHLTQENAPALAEICVRLDGLPLAIELAASHIKLLPPQTLLKRLEHRLQILKGGARNLPLRQQTLRNTIAWSYDLLGAQEQRLFRRFAVFVGGCTIEALEAISTALDDEGEEREGVLDTVASLIDKSLLQQAEQEGEIRLQLLETIREYALEQFVAKGEADAVGRAHADYYLALAEEAETKFGSSEQTTWANRLEREHGNVRTALSWLLDQGEKHGSALALEKALRLGGTLREFWKLHNHSGEGLRFLERALVRSQGLPVAMRAKALSAAGQMAYFQDDNDRAEALVEESLQLYRELGDTEGIALSLHHLERVARTKGDLSAARSRLLESLELWRSLDNNIRIGWSLFRLACQLVVQGDYTEARALFEEGLGIFREMEYTEGIAYTLIHLAEMHLLSLNDFEQIRTLLLECIPLMREMSDVGGETWCIALTGRLALLQGDLVLARALIADALSKSWQRNSKSDTAGYLLLLADVAAAQGKYAEAGMHYQDSLELFQESGEKQLVALSLEGLASVLVEEAVEIRWASPGQNSAGDDGSSEQMLALWAARLCGLAESLRKAVGAPLPPVERPTYERAVAGARSRLGEAAFNRARREGRTMSLEQVFSLEKSDPALEQVEQVLRASITGTASD